MFCCVFGCAVSLMFRLAVDVFRFCFVWLWPVFSFCVVSRLCCIVFRLVRFCLV